MTAAVTVPQNRRAILITPNFSVVDGAYERPDSAVRLTPEDTWSAGFGALLDRLAKQYDRASGGVLVLDGPAATALKLPTTPADRATVGLDDARAAGWLHGTVGAWTTFYGEDRPTIVVLILTWPDLDRCPLVHKAAGLDTVYRLAMWHELTGTPWSGTPGVAGLKVFRATCPEYPMPNGRKGKPTFKHPDMPGLDNAYELDFDPSYWSRPQTSRYAHGWDASRMYLAAAQTCEVLSPWSLKHTGRLAFNPKLAGWWKVALGPWNDDRIPAPAGPSAHEGLVDTEPRWLTTPRMALLDELQQRGGAFQPFEILDSWTAPGRRILRDWAETLEQTYQTARGRWEATGEPFGRDQDAGAVRTAVKGAYSETVGMMNRPTNSLYRPDWHYTIIGQGGANLWRRMYAVGLQRQVWPLEIKVDCIWYPSESYDPVPPTGIPLHNARGLTDALGTFKFNGTRERGKA